MTSPRKLTNGSEGHGVEGVQSRYTLCGLQFTHVGFGSPAELVQGLQNLFTKPVKPVKPVCTNVARTTKLEILAIFSLGL